MGVDSNDDDSEKAILPQKAMGTALKVVAFLILVYSWRSGDSVTYKLSNVVCASYNLSWVRINECRLKAISRNKTVFNFNATFIHPVKDIVSHTQMFKRASGYKPWLFNNTIDACRFLKKPFNPFNIYIWSIYKDFSNINHTCPLYGDILIRGMYLTTEIKTLPFPTGDYMLSINWIFQGNPQFVTNVSWQFIENLI